MSSVNSYYHRAYVEARKEGSYIVYGGTELEYIKNFLQRVGKDDKVIYQYGEAAFKWFKKHHCELSFVYVIDDANNMFDYINKLTGEDIELAHIKTKKDNICYNINEVFLGGYMEKIYGEEKIILPNRIEVPEIDDEALAYLYSKIRPIITVNEVKYLLKKYKLYQLRNIAYVWGVHHTLLRAISDDKLETIEEFPCFHTYNSDQLFKPTVAEVLAQLPPQTIREANAFEIVERPKSLDDMLKYPEVHAKGLHLSKVKSYKIHR